RHLLILTRQNKTAATAIVLLDLHAARLDRRFPFLDFALDEISEPLWAAFARRSDGCAKLGEPLLHFWRRDGTDGGVVEFLDHVGWRAFWQEQRAPCIGLHIETLLACGGEVRQHRRALLGHDGNALHLAAVDLWLASGDDFTQEIDTPTDEVLHRRGG